MIYQLKVTLNHMPSPVWRRIEVDQNSFFDDLHFTIQAAFNWRNTDLHNFQIMKSNNEDVSEEGIEIGPSLDELPGFLPSILGEHDEYVEMVSEWLIKKKDCCLYTYNFMNDWQHEVVLEDIIEREAYAVYPRCTEAMGVCPDEFELMFAIAEDTEELDSKEPDSQELCNEINERIQELIDNNYIQSDDVSMNGWLDLFSVADELKQLQPWTWMKDNQIFALDHPTENHLVYCSIMGAAQQEFGLAVYIGDKGLASLQKTMDNQPISELIYEQQSLLISFSNRDELNKEDYKLIKFLGLKYRGKKQWPMFRSYVPGYYPWLLNREEAELLVAIIPQVTEICNQIKEHPSLVTAYNGEEIAYFNNSGECEIIAAHHIEPDQLVRGELTIDDVSLKRMKKQFQRIGIPIEVDYFYMNEAVQDHDGQRPYFPTMLLGVEKENHQIVFQEFLRPFELHSVPDRIVKMFNNLQALPTEIWLQRQELHTMLEPLAKKLNIKLVQLPQLPLINLIKKELL